MGKSNYSKAALCICGWKLQEKETIEGELDAAQWKMHQEYQKLGMYKNDRVSLKLK